MYKIFKITSFKKDYKKLKETDIIDCSNQDIRKLAKILSLVCKTDIEIGKI